MKNEYLNYLSFSLSNLKKLVKEKEQVVFSCKKTYVSCGNNSVVYICDGKILKFLKGKNKNVAVVEYLISKELNQLRKIDIPNFCYTYGYGPKYEYIVYENIEGISYFDYVENNDLKKITYSYIQILNALIIAQKFFDYCHYDLLLRNVLCKKIPHKKYYIKSHIENYYILCEDEYIFTIIDNEFSHIKNKNNNSHISSSTFFTDLNIYPDMCIPLTDAYKLLVQLYLLSNKLNDLLFYKYFYPEITNENIKEKIFSQSDKLFNLPCTKNTSKNDENWNHYLNNYNFTSNIDMFTKKLDINDYFNYCIKECETKGFNILIKNDNIDLNIPIVKCNNDIIIL